MTPDSQTLTIDGMTCGHCVAAVRTALEGVPGVTVRDVQIGRAEVDAAPDVSRQQLVEAVEAVGFDVVEASGA